MTEREQLREKMLISGDLAKPNKNSQLWVQAFDLYKAQTGDYEVSMGCGSCFQKVKRWLEQ